MNNEYLTLLNLISSTVGNSEIDISSLGQLSSEDWKELMLFAQRQGVVAIVFPTIANLKNHIPFDIYLEWLGRATCVRQKYEQFIRVLRLLVCSFDEKNYELMVLKGVGLSYLYTKPDLRDFCDLDIFLLDGKYDDFNKDIESIGLQVDYAHAKHATFDFCGCHIENHKFFVSNSTYSGRAINGYLLDCLQNDKPQRTPDGWFVPPTSFQTLFLFKHLCSHLSFEGLSLKQLVDWGLFLKVNETGLITTQMRNILFEQKLEKIWTVFAVLAGEIIGEDLSAYYLSEVNQCQVGRIRQMLIDSANDSMSSITACRFLQKVGRLFSNKWLYDSGLLPDAFWKDVFLGSIKAHVKSPQFI